jgi:hypothetical protein
VAVAGTAPPGTTVTVSAALEAPAEVTFEIRSASGAPVELEIAPPSPPEPLSLTADGTGAFGADLSLAPGTWEVSLSAEGYEPISRRVVVGVEDGLRARLEIDGGESYLLLEEDGEVVEDVSGLNAADGDVVELSAEDALRVRVGNAGVVRVTINGIVIGLMGDEAQVVEWRVTRAANTGS